MSHAEVSEVWPRDGRIVIRGRIASSDAPPTADWRLRLVSRERRRQRPPMRRRVLNRVRALADRSAPRTPGDITIPVSVEKTDFEAVIPLRALVSSKPLPRELWDLYLVPSGKEGPALRLGRHLDGMPGKKQIVVFPQQWVNEPGRLSIRPYYTDADHLSIRCLRRNEDR